MKKQSCKKEEVIMATLATPKKNSYIIKKGCAAQIVESKASPEKAEATKKNAETFKKNNIVKR